MNEKIGSGKLVSETWLLEDSSLEDWGEKLVFPKLVHWKIEPGKLCVNWVHYRIVHGKLNSEKLFAENLSPEN